jgi:hypothetical protein
LENERAISQDTLPEKNGRIVENHKIQLSARHFATKTPGQSRDRIEAMYRHASLIKEHCDVVVAVFAGPLACPAAKQKPQAISANAWPSCVVNDSPLAMFTLQTYVNIGMDARRLTNYRFVASAFSNLVQHFLGSV